MDFKPNLFYLQAHFSNVQIQLGEVKQFAWEWSKDSTEPMRPCISLHF